MATFDAADQVSERFQLAGNNFEVPGLDVTSPREVPPGFPDTGVEIPLSAIVGGDLIRTGGSLGPGVGFPAGDQASEQDIWFEKIHVFPREILFGNVISEQLRPIEAYSAFRRTFELLNDITQDAGAGVTLEDLPTLPFQHPPQFGIVINVRVTTSGAPSFNGQVLFDYDVIADIPVFISGERVVMFPFQPEAPVTETLGWATDILEAANGIEKRISYRNTPRQEFAYRVRMEDFSLSREAFQNLLFEWASRVFGLPIWSESRPLAADATAGDFTIQVDTTFGDFRVGSLAMVRADDFTFDALEIASLTTTSITFSSAIANSYLAGFTTVLPLRAAIISTTVQSRRFPVGLEDEEILFRVLDNDVDLSDTSAFSEFNSRVLFDDANIMPGSQLPDNISKRVITIDNKTASIFQDSLDLKSRYGSVKTFDASTAEEIWEVRQVLHALRGSQKAFYLPTFYPDFTAVQDLVNGSDQLQVAATGYSQYVNEAEPNTSIAVYLNDGTRLYRNVLSNIADVGFDTLTLDDTWPGDITLAEIDRICYVRLVRIAADKATFKHERVGEATITIPTKAVFE